MRLEHFNFTPTHGVALKGPRRHKFPDTQTTVGGHRTGTLITDKSVGDVRRNASRIPTLGGTGGTKGGRWVYGVRLGRGGSGAQVSSSIVHRGGLELRKTQRTTVGMALTSAAFFGDCSINQNIVRLRHVSCNSALSAFCRTISAFD